MKQQNQQKTINKESVTFWRHLIAGSVSGAVSKTITAPLERIRLIQQTQFVLRIAPEDKIQNSLKQFLRIYRQQGFLSFWRGNGVNVFRIIPNICIRFTIYDKFKQYLFQNGEANYEKFSQFIRRLSAGFISGVFTMLLTYPFDIVRVRISVDMSSQDKLLYKSFSHCVKKMSKLEGVFSHYNGFLITSLGFIPYYAITFLAYDTIKQNFNINQNSGIISSIINTLGIGSVAGMISQILIHPLDTIRRRLQVNGGINCDNIYKGALDCYRKMYKTEGIKSFYYGLGLSLLKIIPASGIQFSIYDIFRNQIFY